MARLSGSDGRGIVYKNEGAVQMLVSLTGRLLHFGVSGTALCSYSIYLTHTTFDPVVRHLMENSHRGITKSVIVMTVTWIGGIVFYFLAERPAIISRDKYLKSTPAAVEVPIPQMDMA